MLTFSNPDQSGGITISASAGIGYNGFAMFWPHEKRGGGYAVKTAIKPRQDVCFSVYDNDGKDTQTFVMPFEIALAFAKSFCAENGC
jgi:hypothetical protein